MVEAVLTHNRFAERVQPERAALLLVDCQENLLSELSDDPTALRNNLVALARLGFAAGLPTVLSVCRDPRLGPPLPELVQLFGRRSVVERQQRGFWDSETSHEAVRATGRRTLILAGLSPGDGIAGPALAALAEGYTVHAVTDASSGGGTAAERIGTARMSAAGISLTSWVAVMAVLSSSGTEIAPSDAAALSHHLAHYSARGGSRMDDTLGLIGLGLSAAPRSS